MAYEIFRASRAAVRAFSDVARAKRMREFEQRMRPTAQPRIIDLGGTPEVWRYIREPLDITIVNLPGETGQEMPSHHRVEFIEGDACNLPQFEDGCFDLVFSNSVIEHVGDDHKQEHFAAEVRRLGKSYWVQTPSKWFPIEAHTGMPLWWFYPEPARQFFLKRWHRSLPAWSDSMAATRVLSRQRMQNLFPGARIYTETVVGVPKSYTAFIC